MTFNGAAFGSASFNGPPPPRGDRRRVRRIAPSGIPKVGLAFENKGTLSVLAKDISTRGAALLVGKSSFRRLRSRRREIPDTIGFTFVSSESGPITRTAKIVYLSDTATEADVGAFWVLGIECELSSRELDTLVGTESGEVIYEATDVVDFERTAITLTTIDSELKRYFAKHPEKMYAELSSRKFEELVADVLRDLGFEVELTKATRDGGFDIYAYVRNEVVKFLTLVECKRWAPHRKVGIEIVRCMQGAIASKDADRGLIVTTSFFTKPAVEDTRRYFRQLQLVDFETFKKWLGRYAT